MGGPVVGLRRCWLWCCFSAGVFRCAVQRVAGCWGPAPPADVAHGHLLVVLGLTETTDRARPRRCTVLPLRQVLTGLLSGIPLGPPGTRDVTAPPGKVTHSSRRSRPQPPPTGGEPEVLTRWGPRGTRFRASEEPSGPHKGHHKGDLRAPHAPSTTQGASGPDGRPPGADHRDQRAPRGRR